MAAFDELPEITLNVNKLWVSLTAYGLEEAPPA